MDFKIQRIYWTVIILLVCSFLPRLSYAQGFSERISRFDVVAHINTDSTVRVEEKITYEFGSNTKHGIFRDIPVQYQTSFGNQLATIRNISVIDDAGTPYHFTTSRKGNDLEIKIGDANYFVTGTKTYDISYTVSNAIGYFKDYDELYWNATGNSWEVPIEGATESIFLPTPVQESGTQASCYQGVFGSTQKCPLNFEKDPSGRIVGVHFSSESLKPHEGLTGAIGFPKGIVIKPTRLQQLQQVILDNIILGLPIVVFIGMFLLWFKKGKDPKGRGTIVPEYDSPENLTPLEVSALLHQGARNNDISAEIIHLARNGFLTINKIEEKILFIKGTDYQLIKIKNITDSDNPIDLALMTGIFIDDTGDEAANIIPLSSLQNRFYKDLPKVKKAAMNTLIEKGYYPSDPSTIIGKYVALAVLIFIVLWFVAASGLLNVATGISLAVSAAIIVIFGLLMPKVTPEGAIMRERIEGLKLYIKVAEEERIKFSDAPEKNPELFEKLLPYAMVFGLEKEWAKQFEDILTNPPSWYNDAHGGAFNAVIFMSNISSFSTAASSTMASAPGGSSGSGGGGSSGGGGGGGGGGSW